MEVDFVKLKDVSRKIDEAVLVKKKRERFVCRDSNFHYKIWVPNWTQGDILKHALDTGYYTFDNASALVSLIVDESGQRGYITKNSVSLGQSKSWKYFCDNTNLVQRKKFILSLLKNSFSSGGLFVDLVPGNVVICDGKVSLIDLDSFNSFNLIFRRVKESYEKFELDAWWKPHETAKRDTDIFYRAYVDQCLGHSVDFKIDSEESVNKLISIIEK